MAEVGVEPDFLGRIGLHLSVPTLFVVGLGCPLHEGELVGLALLPVTVQHRDLLRHLLLPTFLLPIFLFLTALLKHTMRVLKIVGLKCCVSGRER